jgi:hypothetical protein
MTLTWRWRIAVLMITVPRECASSPALRTPARTKPSTLFHESHSLHFPARTNHARRVCCTHIQPCLTRALLHALADVCALDSDLTCYNNTGGGSMLLAVPSSADCAAHATALNALLDACGGSSGNDSHVTCTTRTLLPGYSFLDAACTRTLAVSLGIDSVIEAYTEVYPNSAALEGGGGTSGGVECSIFSDLLRAASPEGCNSTARILNAAITESTASAPFFGCGAPSLPLVACGNGVTGWCVCPFSLSDARRCAHPIDAVCVINKYLLCEQHSSPHCSTWCKLCE